MSNSQDILQSYFRAWTTRDTAVVKDMLSDEFEFWFGDHRMGNRDAFLDSSAYPVEATTDLLEEAYGDRTGIQLYRSTNGSATVVIAEALTVHDDRIVKSVIVTDPAAFQAFMMGKAPE